MPEAIVTLRPATPADIETIMDIERQPGFEAYVGRSARSIHDEQIQDPAFAYRIGLQDGVIWGFAILRGIGDPMGGIYLKRIAVREPGQGLGSALMAAIIDEAFSFGDIHRFHLDHFADNLRAHRAYEKAGLRQEGILRDAFRFPDGRFADLVVMAITRPEWALRRKQEELGRLLSSLTPLQIRLRERALAEIADRRAEIFVPLGASAIIQSELEAIFPLWLKAKGLHPSARSATEAAYERLDENVGAAEAIRRLARDLSPETEVALLFTHLLREAAPYIDWYERFAGALSCPLETAIDMISQLERAESPLFESPIAVLAKGSHWAFWIEPQAVTMALPTR